MAANDPYIAQHYENVRSAGGYLRCTDRSLLEVTGGERAAWLHNLVTNVVNSLHPGDGNYAFAINTQGRTLFDLNMLVAEDRIYLDVDARWAESALAHLNKYIIVEDVALTDVSGQWSRFAALGPSTPPLVESLGMGNNFEALASVQHVEFQLDGLTVRLVKNNLGPILRAEFLVPASNADAFSALLGTRADALGMTAIDQSLLRMIRIEAGVPASVDDIDDQAIPPETLQMERGISYVKGCYLGQEVIERMRSRGSMAKRLVGLRIAGDTAPPHGAPVFADDKEVGRVTSSCHSVALGSVLALGYIKTMLVQESGEVMVAIGEDAATGATITDLPLATWVRDG